jgi:hypothetical protein
MSTDYFAIKQGVKGGITQGKTLSEKGKYPMEFRH